MSHDALRALIEHGEEQGCINLSAFSELVQELELEGEAIVSVRSVINPDKLRHLGPLSDLARKEWLDPPH